MDFPFYKNKIEDTAPVEKDSEITLARKYLPDDDLVDAVNVALLLKQPLLLTGEPGTGKTQLAFNLSWQLHLKDEAKFKSKKPLVYETKSTSTARDLFYTYDTVGRFHAAQIAHLESSVPSNKQRGGSESEAETAPAGRPDAARQKIRSAEEFITYNALGKAILFAKERNELSGILPPNFSESAESGKEPADEESSTGWQRRSVVLIDEIDKAPRDFPNDILNEIEKMYFRIPELNGEQVKAEDDEYRPVIILTSNSEKNLPDAFLRRCVYYHIKFPKRERMREIVLSHFKPGKSSPDANDSEPPAPTETGIKQALDLFYKFRDADRNLKKTPATAEFISWVRVMQQLVANNQGVSLENLKSPAGWKKLIRPTLGVLFKFREDFRAAKEIIFQWEPTTEANKS